MTNDFLAEETPDKGSNGVIGLCNMAGMGEGMTRRRLLGFPFPEEGNGEGGRQPTAVIFPNPFPRQARLFRALRG